MLKLTWKRMLTILNSASGGESLSAVEAYNRMKPSSDDDRVVEVMDALVTFTGLMRDVASYLVDRDSERKESAEALSKPVNLTQAT